MGAVECNWAAVGFGCSCRRTSGPDVRLVSLPVCGIPLRERPLESCVGAEAEDKGRFRDCMIASMVLDRRSQAWSSWRQQVCTEHGKSE